VTKEEVMTAGAPEGLVFAAKDRPLYILRLSNLSLLSPIFFAAQDETADLKTQIHNTDALLFSCSDIHLLWIL
jgi:hypothetical protein